MTFLDPGHFHSADVIRRDGRTDCHAQIYANPLTRHFLDRHCLAILFEDPQASDILYLKAFIAPFTVNTTPDGTLKALATHTELGRTLAIFGGDREEVLAQIAESTIDLDALLAVQLQGEGSSRSSNRGMTWWPLSHLRVTKFRKSLVGATDECTHN